MVTYNQNKRRFEENGVAVEPAVLALLIGRLMETAKREARSVSIKLERGVITVEQWGRDMAQLLRSAHITAASIGRGGIDRMTAADWLQVERMVMHQTDYLEKFRNTIVTGTTALAAGLIARRAVKYVAAVHTSFASSVQTAQLENRSGEVFVRRILTARESCSECIGYAGEWMPIGEMVPIGNLRCGSNCRCYMEYR